MIPIDVQHRAFKAVKFCVLTLRDMNATRPETAVLVTALVEKFAAARFPKREVFSCLMQAKNARQLHYIPCSTDPKEWRVYVEPETISALLLIDAQPGAN